MSSIKILALKGYGAEISTRFDTREEADAFAALFAKSTRLHVAPVSAYQKPRTFVVMTRIKLVADGSRGDRNEAGIKRYASILKTAAKHDIEIDFVSSVFATRDDFEQHFNI